MNAMKSLRGWVGILMVLLAGNFCGAQGEVQQGDVYRRLKAEIDQIRVVDTHEHLDAEAQRLKQPADCLAQMLHYTESDLHSAGMAAATGQKSRVAAQDMSLPFTERWAEFMKYWPEVRFTGYGKALGRCVQDLYGVDLARPTPQTGAELNKCIGEKMQPGFYRWALKEKARIEVAIMDVSTTEVDRELFVPVLRFDSYVTLQNRKHLAAISARTGVTIETLEDLVKALEVDFEKGVKGGMVAVKSGLAYSRRIYYPKPEVEDAQTVFDQIMEGGAVGPESLLHLQNYMMHQVCRLAGEHHLPFQIHTGLQTGFGNDITNSKPTDLISLFKAWPETKFVIFHGSYPYGTELSVLAKNYANVYIDMCWLHIISPKVARDYLAEWIETVLANKIMGFGGDYRFVEGSYAHAEMARENVARVLAEKVAEGYMTEADAAELARKILRENALALYGLKER